MRPAPLPFARRAVAALALFAVLGAVAAPVCAEGMGTQAAPTHCADPGDPGMPGHQAPDHPPVHHHSPALCASGGCVGVQFLAAPSPAAQVVVVPVPTSVESILTSTVQPHTTPPPRS